jgi:hypothetical protein
MIFDGLLGYAQALCNLPVVKSQHNKLNDLTLPLRERMPIRLSLRTLHKAGFTLAALGHLRSPLITWYALVHGLSHSHPPLTLLFAQHRANESEVSCDHLLLQLPRIQQVSMHRPNRLCAR